MSAPDITFSVPSEIDRFFNHVYKCDSQAEQNKKNMTYSVQGKGISITTDSSSGCHIEVKEVSSEEISSAREAIEQLTEFYRTSNAFDAIWIDIDLPARVFIMGSIAPSSFEIGMKGKGDLIYDFDQKKIRIWQWINPNKKCTIFPWAVRKVDSKAVIVDTYSKKLFLGINFDNISLTDNEPHTLLQKGKKRRV